MDLKRGRNMTETEIINKKIKPYLQSEYGARVIKYHGGPFSEAGVADLLCCIKGVFAAFEVKRPGEKPRANQVAFLESIQATGGKAGVIFTDTFAEDINRIMG